MKENSFNKLSNVESKFKTQNIYWQILRFARKANILGKKNLFHDTKNKFPLLVEFCYSLNRDLLESAKPESLEDAWNGNSFTP